MPPIDKGTRLRGSYGLLCEGYSYETLLPVVYA